MQSQAPGSEPGRGPPGRRQPKRPAEHEGAGAAEERGKRTQPSPPTPTTAAGAIRGLLRDFFEQQLRLDARRQEAMERQAQERLFFEDQWRQAMRRIEQERLLLEHQWMEREEQRRAREEARAERRDALLTNLLTRLLQGDL